MTIKNFEDLECWKAGRDLRRFIQKINKKMPLEEKYVLVSQMRRASRSVTNNIAEGFGRFHFKENIQFCRHSRGSLSELLDHMMIALEEKYIELSEYEEGKTLIDKTGLLINGYINYLKKATIREQSKQVTSNK
jgi:four helix bundle protein